MRRWFYRFRWWLIVVSATLFLLAAHFELSILPNEIVAKCKKSYGANEDSCRGYAVALNSLDLVAKFLRPYSEVLTAISGFIIAAFTFTLWRATTRMWRTSIEQIDLAKKAFIASNRPKLKISNVALESIGGPPEEGFGYFVPGEHISGRLFVRNVGGSEAIAISGVYMIFWNGEKRGLPMIPPYEERMENFNVSSLLPGQNTIVPFQSDEALGDEWVTRESPSGGPIGGPREFFTMGFVRYEDGNKNMWRDAFCREFRITHETPDGRFHVVKNPDYESES